LIEKKEVRRIAALARLRLDDDQVAALQRDMSQMLEYVRLLDELDLTGVQPYSQPAAVDSGREDGVAESLTVEAALASAPARVDNFFRVPAVLKR
jgi:aspartyl-tRNA(Asn)/glutamyl-tRNA(Gln) amidotransferase subunit C